MKYENWAIVHESLGHDNEKPQRGKCVFLAVRDGRVGYVLGGPTDLLELNEHPEVEFSQTIDAFVEKANKSWSPPYDPAKVSASTLACIVLYEATRPR